MSSSCPALSGEATIVVKNISSRSISGKLHFSVKERHVPLVWANLTEAECCNRMMLPDYNGESVTLGVGESKTFTRSFSLKSSWNKEQCRVLSFFQKADKEIVEGCRIKVNEGTPIVDDAQTKYNKLNIVTNKKSFKILSDYSGDCAISFLDLQGRTIKHFTSLKTNNWIAIPKGLHSGIYCIRANIDNRTYVQKLNLLN